MDARNEIREFLTSQAGEDHAGAGGAAHLRRRPARVPGLRREEVALLAGVSVDYYTRLERGNASGVSETVLEALARALQLDEAERAHLFDLARATQTTTRTRRRPAPQRVRPSVQRMLDAMTGAPAFVRNGRMDILAANRLGLALYSRACSPTRAGPRTPPASSSSTRARRTSTSTGSSVANDAVADPALRSRPQPVRPRPLRSRRRALDAERAVPHALGRAQRALPRHRRQAVPPPGRRRPQPDLRDDDARRRPGADDVRLHRRARLEVRGGAEPARELDGDTRAQTKETIDADHEEQHRDEAGAERLVHRRGLHRRGRGAVGRVAA